MSTETIDPRYAELDLWPTTNVLAAMLEAQLAAVAAVRPALASLALAADAAAARLGSKGRLIYVGAGTSGRLGAQDGTELPPTFNWPKARVVFVLAGGPQSLTRSAEGAEDDAAEGRRAIDGLRVSKSDVAIGLAASGATPFTIAAIERARRRGALTIAIASNAKAPLLNAAEHPILTDTGAEVIAGSTRMKAGTAHKVVLNLLSSAIMVRLGRVHGGIMIDMAPTNAKLRRRAARIVAHVAKCAAPQAERALKKSGGDIKTAVLIARGLSRSAAVQRLAANKSYLRKAMADASSAPSAPKPTSTARKRSTRNAKRKSR